MVYKYLEAAHHEMDTLIIIMKSNVNGIKW